MSYLSLIDVHDLAMGLRQMVATLHPGGMLLVASLTSFNTARPPKGSTKDSGGTPRFRIDDFKESARPGSVGAASVSGTGIGH